MTRRLGVEEELLLVDAHTGDLRAAAPDIIAACAPAPAAAAATTTQVKPEFFRSQVEIATPPRVSLAMLGDDVRQARSDIAEAAASLNVVPVAVPGPVVRVTDPEATALSPGERYEAIARHYGQIARDSVMCALHVHVEVTDDEEGVAVIDRVRPWIPLLIAISGNSPYWRGQDTGYDSWRSRIWNMWPTSGPTELFGGAAAYRTAVRDLVGRGAANDIGLVNLDVRLSHRYPTVEFRVADVCTELEDALVVAALARAMVTHFADEWRAGCPADTWRVEELRTAAWRAARFGLGGTLVSPVSRRLEPAHTVLTGMATLLAGALEAAGDTDRVNRGLASLGTHGNGAERQRRFLGRGGTLTAVVADLSARTLGS